MIMMDSILNSGTLSRTDRSRITNEQNLDKIFLKKTNYKIINKQVQQIEQQEFQPPTTLKKEITKFESGQVYEIVYKDTNTGDFMTSC